MVRRVNALLKQSVILVADHAFAKRSLICTCISEGGTLISRVEENAVLYEAPTARRTPGRGRPRKYGMRLPSLATLAKTSNGFHHYRLRLYGKRRLLGVKRVTALWKPAGQMVQVLIVSYQKAKRPTYFFSTDGSLSVANILVRVAARWSLETLFPDGKEYLGLEQWQCRVQVAVTRSVPLACVATTLLIVWGYQEASQGQPEFWDPVPWYRKKTTPNMAEVIYQVRCRTRRAAIFSILSQTSADAEKSALIWRLLRHAA